jgi:hypothetical protein
MGNLDQSAQPFPHLLGQNPMCNLDQNRMS